MRCVSVASLLAALGCTVNAVPVLSPEAPLHVRAEGDKGTFTLGAKLAPFQNLSSLPDLKGAPDISFNLTGYDYGYSPDSDQYKCHGSAGLVIRLAKVTRDCHHPYLEPFLRFAYVDCKKVPNFAPYFPVKAWKEWCSRPSLFGGNEKIDF